MASQILRARIAFNNLPAISRSVKSWGAAWAFDTAGEIVKQSRANLLRNGSYRTGALYEGQHVEPVNDFTAMAVSERDVPGDSPLVPRFVEYGTSRAAAKPYFRPAVETVRKSAYAKLRSEFAGALGGSRIRRLP